MKNKTGIYGMLAVLVLFTFSFSVTGCSKKEKKYDSAVERLYAVRLEDGAYVLDGLPWNSTQEEVMQVQGWTGSDLADANYVEGDSPMTITEKMNQEDFGGSIRFINYYYKETEREKLNFYDDGGLVSSGYWVYFDTEEEAWDFFEDYGEALTELFPEQIGRNGESPVTAGQSFDSGRTERKSSIKVQYMGNTDDFVIGPIGKEAEKEYVVLIMIGGPL